MGLLRREIYFLNFIESVLWEMAQDQVIARSITLGWRLHRYNIIIIVVVQIVLEMKALDASGSPSCRFKRLLLAVMRYQVLGLP